MKRAIFEQIYINNTSSTRDKAYAKGQEVLNNSNLKSQMKAQIESMLEAKGIPFEKIETVFENIYNQSVADTLNAEGMITGRGARGLSKKGKAYINIKNMVDSFVNTFNTNIAKAIDEMNASDKDMDTIDLDYTQAGKDENGNPITQDGVDISTLYASGKTLTTKKKGEDYYVSLAEKMIDNMKSQLLKKAKAMCDANGVTFDNKVFDTMFNNAKSIAIYNNDGPGFQKTVIDTNEYKNTIGRLHTYIPQTSIIGRLLNHKEATTIIKSTQTGIMQHDLYSWQLLGAHFIEDTLTNSSEFIDQTITNWLNEVSPEQREKFIDTLFEILNATEAKTLAQLSSKKFETAKIILSTYKNIDEESKEIISKTLLVFFHIAKNNIKLI